MHHVRKPKAGTACWIAGVVLLSLFLNGCQSSVSSEGGSRKVYDYVPPVLATPTPDPTSVSAPEDKKSGGFFSKLFSGKSSAEGSGADVQRVGDQENRPPVVVQEAEVPGGPSENVYRLKANDTVYITLTGPGGLNEEVETVVDDEGAVKLRFIGAVPAAGLTTTALEREIELEYTERQQIYRDVTARVLVPNTFYFIGGEVRQPGRFPLIGRVTLSQAVVAAGNFTEWANPRKVILVRNNERVELDFRDITRNPLMDVELLAGDVITVDRSTF